MFIFTYGTACLQSAARHVEKNLKAKLGRNGTLYFIRICMSFAFQRKIKKHKGKKITVIIHLLLANAYKKDSTRTKEKSLDRKAQTGNLQK